MKKVNKVPQIELADDFFGTVLNCAVRYCIGRMTYMPSLVTDFIRPLLPHLSDKTLWCFERDIEDQSNYGMKMDKELWMRFLSDVKTEIQRRKGADTDDQ